VPELDQDLVNLIMLGFLGLIVLELLGVMGSLRRNRKAIDRLAKARERDNSWSALPSGGGRSDEAYGGRPAEARPQPAQTTQQPQPAPVQREPEPAYSGSSAQTGAQGAQPSAATQRAAVSSSVAGQPAASSSADTGASGAAGASQEPREQPFERDGRWWFRRGSELLIYDESTGQWLPAPSGQGAAPSGTQPMPTTISDVSGATTGQPSGEQGFWKCPTCGAVNGSTATTCRMCFTARP
jgi:hypothetical protein